jgi:hypothetical protein
MATQDPEALLESLRFDGTIPAAGYVREFEEATRLCAGDGPVIDDKLKRSLMAYQLSGGAARWYAWQTDEDVNTYTKLVVGLKWQYPERQLTPEEEHLQMNRERQIRTEHEYRLQEHLRVVERAQKIDEIMNRAKRDREAAEQRLREAAEKRAQEEAAKRAREYKAERDAEFARRLNEFFKKSGGWYPQMEQKEDADQEGSNQGQKLNKEPVYDESHDEHQNLCRDPALEKRIEQRVERAVPSDTQWHRNIYRNAYGNEPANDHPRLKELQMKQNWRIRDDSRKPSHNDSEERTEACPQMSVLNEEGATLATETSLPTRACVAEDTTAFSGVDGTGSISRSTPCETSGANRRNTIPTKNASNARLSGGGMGDTHDTKMGDTSDVSDVNDMSSTHDESAADDPRCSDTTETDELPNDRNSAAILPTMPEKPDDIYVEDDTTIRPTNEQKLYTTSRGTPRNGAQWQGVTAKDGELHDMSGNHTEPDDTMSAMAIAQGVVPTNTMAQGLLRTSNWKPAGIPNESLLGCISTGGSFLGLPAMVWVLVVDGDLRRCWDPGGKFTVLPWATHAEGRLSEFRREPARLRTSLKGVGVTQYFVHRG